LKEIAMQNFRSGLCSLVSVALLATPLSQAHAQSQATVNAACVSYSVLPTGTGIAVKLPGDQDWRPVLHSSQQVMLRSPDGGTAQVRIWKHVPQGEADLTSGNLLNFTIDLMPTSNPNSCGGGAANYRVQPGADGYTLASTSQPVKREGPSAAAVAVAAVVGLGLLVALFGGGSSSSSGASSRDAEDVAAMEQQARHSREQQARAAAEREAERGYAAAATAAAGAATWERLQRPNSLGW